MLPAWPRPGKGTNRASSADETVAAPARSSVLEQGLRWACLAHSRDWWRRACNIPRCRPAWKGSQELNSLRVCIRTRNAVRFPPR